MSRQQTGEIIAEDHIEYPMQSVLDPPMSAHDTSEAVDVEPGWSRGSSASPARLCRFAIDEGLSNKAMTRRLGISVHAIKFHVEALFAKLEATGRAEAVANGLRGDVIEL
ncbi:MAG: response regulator transcription factor [Rhodopila sp.]